MNAPQRYVGNELNVFRTATLTPSSVLPVEDQVLEVPASRLGTGNVRLTGPYSGAEEATYDIEIVDTDLEDVVVTSVVAAGVGSGKITDIVAHAPAQSYTVELANDGIPTLSAGVAFEGVRIIARTEGAGGNLLALTIDQDGLVFTPQAFSLLEDLPVGAGSSSSGLQGAAYDWDAKVLSADNIIPGNAHRVSFGDDTTNVYLQYKQYVDGEWEYHFVPALKRAVAKGTIVKFVTGGRTVTVTNNGVPAETYTDMVAVYDLLNAIKTSSALLDVAGVVAYDRSPTGQAARELLLRTDAHVEPSTGSGSAAATGFESTFANANAATEIITAECFAVTSADHPLARLGAERWHLRGSVSGDLGDIVTGDPFVDPAGKFGLTIPRKLPAGYGVQRGRFTHTGTQYVPRDKNLQPPICPVALTLGTEAVDQTITLEWTERPSGDCACAGMKVPKLRGSCLGLFDTEGGTLAYTAETVARLTALYEWYASVAEARSSYKTLADAGGAGVDFGFSREDPALGAPLPSTGFSVPGYADPADLDSLRDLIGEYEDVIAVLDEVEETGLRTDSMAAWDAAVTKLQDDVDARTEDYLFNLPGERYKSLLNVALIKAGISPLGKTDASTIESGDGCWRDLGGNYWTVVGSAKGAYAPLFNNTPYYASRLSEDGKKYYSTKEFGLQLNIKCEDLLVFGDRVVLQIGGAGWGATYQPNDRLFLPIIAGTPLQLAGGQDGNALIDFYVSGSVTGALPNYVFDPGSPAPYYEAGALRFLYTPGGIPNKKGDRWTFSVEGGHYRWRKDGGAWSSAPYAAIGSEPVLFDAGLSITFIPGASPSFEAGDRYSFKALQPWAVSNVRTPNASMWRWPGATFALDGDAGTIVDVPGVVIGRHTLPEGATITLKGGNAAPDEWTETLTWNAATIAKEFVGRTARYLRLEGTGATNGGIGWAWAGVMLSTTLEADVDVGDAYKIESGTDLDDGGLFFAEGASGSVHFEKAALTEADAAGLRAWIRWAKRHNDEPCVVIPNILRPDEAYLVQIAVDELTWDEGSKLNAKPGVRDRRYNIDIPLSPVWRA